MVSGQRPLPLPALQEVLLYRKAQQAQTLYAAHLTWLIGAQLFALGGGQDYPVPDALSLFPEAAAPRDRRNAQAVRDDVLARLTHPPRKENPHG